MRILYIVGAGRSGSTLLAATLGALSDHCWPGEPYYLWKEGLVENRLCGCRRPFRECEFWGEVIDRIEQDVGPLDPTVLWRALNRCARTRHLPFLLTPGLRRAFLSRHRYLLRVLAALYRSLAEVSGARVIVEGSKFPSYGLLLEALPDISLNYVQLVRDPRAVAHSWRRVRFNPGSGRQFGRMGPLKSSALWSAWNVAAEMTRRRRLRRSLRVRYEDFVAHPRREIERIGELVGSSPASVDAVFAPDGALRIPTQHSVGGNPVRFATEEGADTRLQLDEEWRVGLPASSRHLVTLETLPLLVSYGYLFGSRAK